MRLATGRTSGTARSREASASSRSARAAAWRGRLALAVGASLALWACVGGLGNPYPRVLVLEPDRVVLAWQTPRRVASSVTLRDPGSGSWHERSEPRRQHRVALEGLAPETTYVYVLEAEQRVLFEGGFTTPADGPADFRFAVLGDSGRGSRAQWAVAEQLEASAPDLVIHTGDVLYRDNVKAVFLAPYARLLARVPFWPVVGNHDVDYFPIFARLFAIPANGPSWGVEPGRAYWFDFSGARFAMIDSNQGSKSLRSGVAPWLRALFAVEPEPRWRLAVLHHPPYTAGKHEPNAVLQAELVPVFEELDLDLVFAGHDHNYQRTAPLRGGKEDEEGIVYIVTGSGGARLYPLAPEEERAAWLRAARDVHGFVRVDAREQHLELVAIDVAGEEIDRVRLPARARGTPAPSPEQARGIDPAAP